MGNTPWPWLGAPHGWTVEKAAVVRSCAMCAKETGAAISKGVGHYTTAPTGSHNETFFLSSIGHFLWRLFLAFESLEFTMMRFRPVSSPLVEKEWAAYIAHLWQVHPSFQQTKDKC